MRISITRSGIAGECAPQLHVRVTMSLTPNTPPRLPRPRRGSVTTRRVFSLSIAQRGIWPTANTGPPVARVLAGEWHTDSEACLQEAQEPKHFPLSRVRREAFAARSRHTQTA